VVAVVVGKEALVVDLVVQPSLKSLSPDRHCKLSSVRVALAVPLVLAPVPMVAQRMLFQPELDMPK